MAIKITREEYEKRFGVAPVAPVRSVLEDEKPAPIRVTRAEYEAMFPNQYSYNSPVRNVVEGKAAFPAELGGAETILPNVARTAGNLPGSTLNLARAAVAPVNPFDRENPLNIGQNLYESGAALKDIYGNRGAVEGTKDIVKGVGSTISKGYDLWKKAGEVIYENLKKNTISEDSVTKGVGLSAGEAMSKVAEAIINDPTLVPSLLYAPGKVRGTGVTDDAISAAARPVIDTTKKAAAPIVKKLDERRVNNVVKEIAKIEDKNAGTRKANVYSKDVQASRQRIAESNVLDGSVDTDGVIRTKVPGGAVDQYRLQSIDGKEDMVRKALVEFNETVPVATVRQALVREVGTSGLEGADLVTALKKIDKEIEGINVRIKGNTDVELWRLQDNKIATTKTINWQTPPEKTTYRKAVARAYKKLVEDNSKKFDVKPVNKELAKYLEDIKRLERLDGLRAEGGRLGKYTASMAGTLIGGAAGSVGGGIGSAVGGIIGGEGAAALKGFGMSRTFKGGGKGLPKNPVLEKARLSIPDKAIKAKVGVPKTKAIIKTEKDIAKNVEAQKKAIKAGDFTLVATLKEVYETLVAKLKELIKEVVEAQKNPQTGQKGSVDFFAPLPKKVSKIVADMTEEDAAILRNIVDNKYEPNPLPRERTLKAMGMEKMTYSEQKELATKILKGYDERWGGVDEVGVATTRPGALDIKKPNSSFMEEAKGKTLDEFVRSQPVVYHGSPIPLKRFSNKKGGVFFTEEYADATGFAGSPDNVYEGYLNFKNPLEIDAKGAKWNDIKSKWGKSTVEINSNAQGAGYDGVIFRNVIDNIADDVEEGIPGNIYYAMKPEDAFINESQLTDIWKKANRTASGEGSLKGALTDTPSLMEEAKGKTLDEFLKAQERNNKLGHSAPSGKGESLKERLSYDGDVTLREELDGHYKQPDDYFHGYTGPRMYGYEAFFGRETLNAIKSAKDKGTIKIYRAVPKDVKNIADGDWVYFVKEQAQTHGKEHMGGQDFKVISKEVSIDDVFWDGNDIREWGYDSGKTRTQLEDIWKRAQE